MKKYQRLEEGLRYNTDYFDAGKKFKNTRKIDTVIGVLEEFIIELKRWKKQGAQEVQAYKGGEFIPLWK